jgi:hypothetical protein
MRRERVTAGTVTGGNPTEDARHALALVGISRYRTRAELREPHSSAAKCASEVSISDRLAFVVEGTVAGLLDELLQVLQQAFGGGEDGLGGTRFARDENDKLGDRLRFAS